MKFEWMVALRYLRSPYKPAVLRLITLLSVVGVAAGVTTLVIALAVNTGFRETLQDRLLGATAHVNLTRRGTDGIRNYREVVAQMEANPAVAAASPAVYQTVLLSSANRSRGIVLKGVDPALEKKSSEVLNRLIAGSADFLPDEDGFEALLIGKTLADEFGLEPGEYVTVISPQGRLTPFGMVPRTRRYRIGGVYDSGFHDYDANWGFVTLQAAQTLAGVGDLVNVVEIRLNDLERADTLAPQLAREAGEGFSSSTWMTQNRALFRALRLEKLVTAIFIGLITFIAGLNILVVLAMTVTDKARDIAVLMALGARRAQVRNIFVLQGFAVGVVGTAIGLVLGYGIAVVADRWRLIPLDAEVYPIAYVPFHANAADALWIAAAALGVSVIATLLPARAAAEILPVEILRYE